jgi:hypothetical protein
VISSSAMNSNFNAISTWANGNVDNSNIGLAGIYASQIKPTNSSQATFGGTQQYTFPSGLSVNGSLSVSGAFSPASVSTGSITGTSITGTSLTINSSGSPVLSAANGVLTLTQVSGQTADSLDVNSFGASGGNEFRVDNAGNVVSNGAFVPGSSTSFASSRSWITAPGGNALTLNSGAGGQSFNVSGAQMMTIGSSSVSVNTTLTTTSPATVGGTVTAKCSGCTAGSYLPPVYVGPTGLVGHAPTHIDEIFWQPTVSGGCGQGQGCVLVSNNITLSGNAVFTDDNIWCDVEPDAGAGSLVQRYTIASVDYTDSTSTNLIFNVFNAGPAIGSGTILYYHVLCIGD